MFAFTGIRLGLLDNMKDVMRRPDGSLTLAREAFAALLTSAVGITVANPADVVKVRFQNGNVPNYTGVVNAYSRIFREEGITAGLWKGFTANLIRNCTISACELTSYVKAKEGIVSLGFQDGAAVHVTSGLTAGLVATLMGSPADVVGTRIVAHKGDAGGLGRYCLDMLRNEGVTSFYKGFVPNFARLGSYNVCLWVFYEQVRKVLS